MRAYADTARMRARGGAHLADGAVAADAHYGAYAGELRRVHLADVLLRVPPPPREELRACPHARARAWAVGADVAAA